MDELLTVGSVGGNLLERVSIGTYRTFEMMGLGLERLVTGQVTPRPRIFGPESARRAEGPDPAVRLAEAHKGRLLVEDRLRDALVAARFVIDVEQIATAGSASTQ
jgi:hypothetical protein